ncbi:hypothetical protein BUALT_Bualt12G0146900 [Buddleja alternifolia]|uniref:Uncharacterized protein n=1 Tax=Buddleja alternifolia TaxID=168488 RepID=A0AAV6WRG6_9LAMI|nr:hypothetical protein BUALT_Bualt12G0146900 [Buddleja alternifolia]
MLDHELKPLFLYVGQFPEGRDIQVDRLCLLLATEALIATENYQGRQKTLMETVKCFLKDLDDRKPVDAQDDKVSIAELNSGKLALNGLESLEILVNFNAVVCNINDLFELDNLQIIAIILEGVPTKLKAIVKWFDEKIANILQSFLNIRNFDCYRRDTATIFNKLLQCKSLHSLHIEGQIDGLPNNLKISPNFTEMVFIGSELGDVLIDELSKLENLRSLVLTDNEFIGKEITFLATSEFSNLRSLKLQSLQYLEKLTFENKFVPKLSTLVIEECHYLKEISMSETLDNQHKRAHGKKGDVYQVQQLPNIFKN